VSRSKHGEDHTAPSEWRPEVDDKLSDHNMERTLEKRLAQSILAIMKRILNNYFNLKTEGIDWTGVGERGGVQKDEGLFRETPISINWYVQNSVRVDDSFLRLYDPVIDTGMLKYMIWEIISREREGKFG
jgi:hypothetical protein